MYKYELLPTKRDTKLHSDYLNLVCLDSIAGLLIHEKKLTDLTLFYR